MVIDHNPSEGERTMQPAHGIGRSLEEVRDVPTAVQRDIGCAFHQAQRGASMRAQYHCTASAMRVHSLMSSTTMVLPLAPCTPCAVLRHSLCGMVSRHHTQHDVILKAARGLIVRGFGIRCLH
jgi:hypothetical protein